MPKIEREFTAPPGEVWAALIDPHTYPEWLIGADRIRDLDDGWPEPGTAFHHRVGVGPFKVDDRSEVAEIVPNTRLVLHIRATPIVQAMVTLTVASMRAGTLLGFEEEPAIPVIGDLVRPVLGPLTRARNTKSLDRLQDFLAR